VFVADAGVLYLHVRDRASRVGLGTAVSRYRQKVAAGTETPPESTATTQDVAASTTVAPRVSAASTAGNAEPGPAKGAAAMEATNHLITRPLCIGIPGLNDRVSHGRYCLAEAFGRVNSTRIDAFQPPLVQ
jgi:hypothetical protein